MKRIAYFLAFLLLISLSINIKQHYEINSYKTKVYKYQQEASDALDDSIYTLRMFLYILETNDLKIDLDSLNLK